ncbi:MAG: phytanoyl-CoA dioxygenase family protein [Saprospiraceae bacterium]
MKTLISPAMLKAFASDGYFALRQAIPSSYLERLQQLTAALIIQEDDPDCPAHYLDNIRYISGLENIGNKGNLCALELLGAPLIQDIATSICGPDFFPMQDFVVVKMLGDHHGTVSWHQDMLHKRTGVPFSMGIYLDDAASGDGALRVVPGSHISGRDICQLKTEPSIEIPMQAGDILIHDMMLAHSSGSMQHNALRRVLYFVFLPTGQVKNEDLYPATTIETRTRLLDLAKQYYAQKQGEESLNSKAQKPGESMESESAFRQQLQEVYNSQVRPRPSAYCLEGYH